MSWLFAARKLRERGVLGINRRNAECLIARNPRSLYPLVDDKLLMRDLCARIGVPTPAVHGIFRYHGDLQQLPALLEDFPDGVIKPARGSGGRGILILLDRLREGFLRPNGRVISEEAIRFHITEILSGMYSLGGKTDAAIVQQRVRLHPAFERISYKGIPDLRIILYRCEPIMAMLRLPTMESNGRANLHQGGVGVGVDLLTGLTHHALHRGDGIDRHPETGEALLDREIPAWSEVLHISRKIARAVGLGFLGVDIVLDADEGPMLLEANARPGLAIQLANDAGLLRLMREIDG